MVKPAYLERSVLEQAKAILETLESARGDPRIKELMNRLQRFVEENATKEPEPLPLLEEIERRKNVDLRTSEGRTAEGED